MTFTSAAALIILVLTYGGVAIGRIPGLRLDRAGIAFLGGAAMIAVGAIAMPDAYRAIDWDTIVLLLAMMIVVAHLKVSGAFRALGRVAIAQAHAPLLLLVMVTALTGVLSAFLVNDAICLVMAPIVLQAAQAMKRNPLPYLLATATASNCGSVATITGNPQNMVIGALSGIPYPAFAAALAPVAIFGLIAVVVIVRIVHRDEFVSESGALNPEVARGVTHPWQMAKAILVCLLLAIAFFAGMPPAEAALFGGAALLFTRAIKPHRIYREIDGPLLVMFAGLFVVVAGAEKSFADAADCRRGQRLGARCRLAPVGGDGGALQHRQQCPGGAGAKAVRHDAARSAQSLAGRGDEFDAWRAISRCSARWRT